MAPMGSWEIDDTIFSDMCASSPLVQLLEYIEACHICEGVAEPSLLAAVNMQTHNAFGQGPNSRSAKVMLCICKRPENLCVSC